MVVHSEESSSTVTGSISHPGLVSGANRHAHVADELFSREAVTRLRDWVIDSPVGASSADSIDFIVAISADTSVGGVDFVVCGADVITFLGDLIVNTSIGTFLAETVDDIVSSITETSSV